MKKIIVSIGVLLFISFFGVSNVSANTVAHKNPEETLKSAYDALINSDEESYADYVIDERFDSKVEATNFYKESFKTDPLIDYKILDKRNNNKSFEFILLEKYKSNAEIKTPITLKKENGSWKVFISKQPLELTQYDVISPATVDVDERRDVNAPQKI